MGERNREPVSSELEAAIAQVCGLLNATTGRLVALLARVLETGCWQVAGIHSPTQWVAWQCGVSPARATSLVAMARRRVEAAARDLGIPAGAWSHPTGERLELGVVTFHEPAA